MKSKRKLQSKIENFNQINEIYIFLYINFIRPFFCWYLGYIPNNALAIEAMLATASLGAVWSSTSPDFGVSVSSFVFYYVLDKSILL